MQGGKLLEGVHQSLRLFAQVQREGLVSQGAAHLEWLRGAVDGARKKLGLPPPAEGGAPGHAARAPEMETLAIDAGPASTAPRGPGDAHGLEATKTSRDGVAPSGQAGGLTVRPTLKSRCAAEALRLAACPLLTPVRRECIQAPPVGMPPPPARPPRAGRVARAPALAAVVSPASAPTSTGVSPTEGGDTATATLARGGRTRAKTAAPLVQTTDPPVDPAPAPVRKRGRPKGASPPTAVVPESSPNNDAATASPPVEDIDDARPKRSCRGRKPLAVVAALPTVRVTRRGRAAALAAVAEEPALATAAPPHASGGDDDGDGPLSSRRISPVVVSPVNTTAVVASSRVQADGGVGPHTVMMVSPPAAPQAAAAVTPMMATTSLVSPPPAAGAGSVPLVAPPTTKRATLHNTAVTPAADTHRAPPPLTRSHRPSPEAAVGVAPLGDRSTRSTTTRTPPPAEVAPTKRAKTPVALAVTPIAATATTVVTPPAPPPVAPPPPPHPPVAARSTLASMVGSFLTLMAPRGDPPPIAAGKNKGAAVKALEAASTAKRLEDAKAEERKARKDASDKAREAAKAGAAAIAPPAPLPPLLVAESSLRTAPPPHTATAHAAAAATAADRARRAAESRARDDEAKRSALEEALRRKEVDAADRRRALDEADKRERDAKKTRLEELRAAAAKREADERDAKRSRLAERDAAEADKRTMATTTSTVPIVPILGRAPRAGDGAENEPPAAGGAVGKPGVVVDPPPTKPVVAATVAPTRPLQPSGQPRVAPTSGSTAGITVLAATKVIGGGAGGTVGGGSAAAAGFLSYLISPQRASDDDDDDDDDAPGGKPRKPVPEWARSPAVRAQLRAQHVTDPDGIFRGVGLEHQSCDLHAIFGAPGGGAAAVAPGVPPPSASKKRKDWGRRSSGGNWADDRLTWKEELAYKRTMGFERPAA